MAWHNKNQDVSSHDIQYIPPDIQESKIHLCVSKCLALKAATRPLQLLTARETASGTHLTASKWLGSCKLLALPRAHIWKQRDIEAGKVKPYFSNLTACYIGKLLSLQPVHQKLSFPSFPVNVCLPSYPQHIWLHSNRFTIRVNAN